jgi:hypothetical protein
MAIYPNCPECGASLEGLDPLGHAYTHYPYVIPNTPAWQLVKERMAYLASLRNPDGSCKPLED